MIPAVMASHLVLAHMERHRYVALDASRWLTALRTLDKRGIAAAVLEEDDLFMLRQHIADTRDERVGEMAHHLFALVLPAQVDELDVRQFHTSVAFGQRDESVHSFFRQIIGLYGRRGSTQEHVRFMFLGQDDRRCPGMIARVGFGLFVTGFMLLIYDDQPDIGNGEEDGTSCSEDHVVS